MYKKITAILFLITIIAEGCVNNEAILEKIDNLLNRNNIDSARTLMDRLSDNSFSKQSDIIYYNLLKTIIDYRTREIRTDSIINSCIKYYEKNQTGNIIKLANAYYYKGVIEFRNKNLEEAALYCKKAEAIATKYNDSFLNYRIAWALGSININSGQQDLALYYYNKQLEYSKGLDPESQYYSCLNMAIYYKKYNNIDSVMKYYNKIELNTDAIQDEPKAYLYNLMGELCMGTDAAMAEKYFNMAIKTNQNKKAYKNLAIMYYNSNNPAKADSIWENISGQPWYELQIEILKYKYYYNIENNKINEASENVEKILLLKDSLCNRIANDKVLEIQQKFNNELKEQEYRTLNKIILTITILIISISISIIIGQKYRNLLLYKEKLENINKITILKKEIEKKEQSSDIEILKKQLDELENRMHLLNPEGEQLYNTVACNGYFSKLNNENIKLYIDFFMFKHEDYITYRDTNYQNLNLKEEFFITLLFLGKSDYEISQILGIAGNSVRTRKSRIKKLHKK